MIRTDSPANSSILRISSPGSFQELVIPEEKVSDRYGRTKEMNRSRTEQKENRDMKNKLRLRPRLVLGLIIMSTVLVLTLTALGGAIYRRKMEVVYSREAFDTASIAAQLIDGDRIAEYRKTLKKDAYYESVHQTLQMIRQSTGVKYLYVVIPEDVQFYIWDTGEEGDEGVCDLGDTDEYYGNGYEIMHAAFSPDAEQTMLVTNGDLYGYLASAYVAILDSRGQPAALASVDISMDIINHEIQRFYLIFLMVSLGIVLVSSLFYYSYIRRILIRPIHILNEDTRKLVSDQMEALGAFRNRVHTGDELQWLGESFEHMTRELEVYIQNLAAVTAEKERIGAELNVATRIQADMLPRIFPPFPSRKEIDLYASMNPAKEVGGDFYDFFLVDEDHLALVMADVSGKGVPAALFMVIAKTLIKNRTQMGGTPGEILYDVNNQLCEGNEEDLFVTVWLSILELSTGKGIAANAGHEHPVVRHKDGNYELVLYKHSPAVAAMEGIRFREHEYVLDPGDRLFVYTDGVPEATNSREELYGTDRMTDALNTLQDPSPQELLEYMKKDIDSFTGDAPQFDDVTMLALYYNGPAT